MSFYFQKQVYEEFVIGVDFTDVLTTGETISAYSVVASDDTTKDGAAVLSSNTVQQKIKAGLANKSYTFSFRVTTSAANKLEEDVKMTVFE